MCIWSNFDCYTLISKPFKIDEESWTIGIDWLNVVLYPWVGLNFWFLLSNTIPYPTSVLKKFPSIFLIDEDAVESTSISSKATLILGDKYTFSYCSKLVAKLNPVFELLNPEVDDLSVEETSKYKFNEWIKGYKKWKKDDER